MAKRPTYEELEQRVKELERKTAEHSRVDKALHSAHQKLRATFDAIQDNMSVVDPDFNLTDVNEVFIKAFGLRGKESVLGRKCFEVLKGRKEVCPDCAVAEVYRTKTVAYRVSTSKDEKRTGGRSFEIFAYPIIDEGGNVSGGVEFARDITERKRLEEALKKAHDDLELKVRKRTAELVEANEQLKREIEQRKQGDEALKRAHDELNAKSRHLQEVNAALKVLLRQREEDKEELQENVLSNVNELIGPHLESLKKSGLDTNQTALVDIVESNLDNIVSPFIGKLSSTFIGLSPMEIRVADFIKEGKTNKEIGELLCRSPNTIKFHRYNVRNKLGLKNKKMNLRSYLLSLTK